MSLLTVEGVTVSRGGRIILSGIDLTVEPGEILGLLGPNGAGKTSLLRVLAGLDKPDKGAVSVDGIRLEAIAHWDRARRIGFLPQPAEAAWPITVAHLVGLGRLPFARPFGGADERDSRAVESALAEADLTRLCDRAVNTLSSGELSRAFLARALAGQPRLLLADEPTANLDPAHQLAAMGMLRRLAANGAGIVMTQHDLPLASRFCDRLLLIGQGKAIALGPPSAVLTPQNLDAVFGIVAHYQADPHSDFFALPWSLAAKPSDGNIFPHE
jgi:iron complex transport system ATP-binding protein